MKVSIQAKDIQFAHRKKVLFEHSSFDLYQGELTALIGLNGVGKSTLLELMMGNHTEQGGEIYILDIPFQYYSKKDLAKLMALVLTSFDIDSELLVSDVLASARLPYTGYFGRLKKDDLAQIKMVSERLKLGHLLSQKFHSCSDGEKQRILIGTAFIKESSIVLLDEPTAFMDLNHKIEFFSILKEQKEDRTIVFSTHDVEMALQVADRFLILHDQKLETFTKQELLDSQLLNVIFSASKKGFNAEGKLEL